MATSFWRVTVRASMRLERLAQTISMTTPTAQPSTRSGGRSRPLTCSASGVTKPSKLFPLGMRLRDLGREDLQFRRGLLDQDARLQAAHDSHGVPPAVGLTAEREREVEIDMAARREHRGEVKRRRQHSHYRDRLVVDDERAADNPGVGGKPALPHPVAEHYRRPAHAICTLRR